MSNANLATAPLSACPPAVFAATHWSVVLAAGHSSVSGAQEALEKGSGSSPAQPLPRTSAREIAETVATPGEVNEELQHLISVLIT